jgi:hypothetical protein
MASSSAKRKKIRWIIPDGYLPELNGKKGSKYKYVSHECLCILNTHKRSANVKLTIYFEDSDPVTAGNIVVPGQRSCHLHMENLKIENKSAIPRGYPYSVMIESNVNIVVQMSRLDTTQAKMAFLSTMGYPL